MPSLENGSLVVLKFGGAAVASLGQFEKISEIILHRKQKFKHVVVAVSAMGDSTDHLLQMAQEVNANPPQRELDMLVSVGERISMSLLAMSLHAKGCAAMSFTGSQAGILTSNIHGEAEIVEVKPKRILAALEHGYVPIVAGFQGMSESGEITTLGRGGTDTTAVALGNALHAQWVEFFKDVDGIFDRNPQTHSGAKLHSALSYKECLQILQSGAQVLHDRCVSMAQKTGLKLIVRPFSDFNNEEKKTVIFS
jgi:aspartate kinase